MDELLITLDDMIQYLALHKEMEYTEYLKWTHDSGLNDLLCKIRESCNK